MERLSARGLATVIIITLMLAKLCAIGVTSFIDVFIKWKNQHLSKHWFNQIKNQNNQINYKKIKEKMQYEAN